MQGWTLAVALIGLVVSIVALAWSIRTERRMPLLVEKQIAALNRESRDERSARVTIRWHSSYLDIANEGNAAAEDIRLTFPGGESPIQVDDAREKLPILILQPDTKVTLLAPRSKANAPQYHPVVSWRDANGHQQVAQTIT